MPKVITQQHLQKRLEIVQKLFDILKINDHYIDDNYYSNIIIKIVMLFPLYGTKLVFCNGAIILITMMEPCIRVIATWI